MFIEKIKIDDFGGTENKEITFKSSLNVIEGENESGKSTVCAFIRFILFGFSDKKERMRCYSFGRNSVRGSMVVCVDGKRYRIEREYTEGSGDKYGIIDLETNAPAYEGKNPGEVFLSVYADVYDHTAFITQSAGGFVNGKTVSEAIENILFGADETINTQKALKRLDDARIMLSHKHGDGGRINELKAEQEKLLSLLESAKHRNAQIIEKEGALSDTLRKIKENEEKAQANKELIDYYETAAAYRLYKQYRHISKKAAETQAVYDALIESYTEGGFLPNAEYIEELGAVIDELKETDEEIRLLQKESSDYEARNTDIFDTGTFIEKADERGGIDELCASFEKIKFRKNLLTAFSIICAVLAVCSGVGGYFLNNIFLPNIWYGIAVGVFLIILAAIFIVSSSKQKMNLQEFLVELDLNSADEFETAVDNYEENSRKIQEHKRRIKEYEDEHKELNAERAKIQDRAVTIAMRWGKSDYVEAYKKAQEVVRRLAESKSEAEKYAMSKDVLKNQVVGLNKDELKAKLDGRPYDEEAFDKQQIEAAIAQKDFYLKINEKLKEKKVSLEKDLAVLYATGHDAIKLTYQIEELEKQIKFLSDKNAALLLAHKKLEEASLGLRSAVIPKLASITSEIMSAVTDGKYQSVGVGKRFDLKYDFEEKNHSIDFLSEGTKDVAYYALRLALIRVLFTKELPAVIFDESFAQIDDKRLSKLFSVLYEISGSDVQFLIFTSQLREAKLLEKNNIEFNKIML